MNRKREWLKIKKQAETCLGKTKNKKEQKKGDSHPEIYKDYREN